MQPVNLWRGASISLIISTIEYPQIVQIWANLCNLWISLYTPHNAPESLKSTNY
jgi:hypothetical protein